MKKIILAFDGQHFSEGAFSMAEWLNEMEPLLVTGVFLSPVDYREIIGYSGMGIGAPILVPGMEQDNEVISQNIERFENKCRSSGLEYRVHRDTDMFALSELIAETRFADLLIVSSELFYENISTNQPNNYLRKTLHLSECPVLLVPEEFTRPEKLILAYDGKASSVFAIKQFSYLFAKLCKMETMVATSGDGIGEVPHMDNITELAARHYPKLTIHQLDLDSAEYFSGWLGEKKNVLLVSGAYGRGELSNFFRKSFITEVIKAHRIPIFIAHH